MHTPVHMFVDMSVHISVHMPMHMSVHVPVHMSVHISVHTSVHMSVPMTVHMPADKLLDTAPFLFFWIQPPSLSVRSLESCGGHV